MAKASLEVRPVATAHDRKSKMEQKMLCNCICIQNKKIAYTSFQIFAVAHIYISMQMSVAYV